MMSCSWDIMLTWFCYTKIPKSVKGQNGTLNQLQTGTVSTGNFGDLDVAALILVSTAPLRCHSLYTFAKLPPNVLTTLYHIQ